VKRAVLLTILGSVLLVSGIAAEWSLPVLFTVAGIFLFAIIANLAF